MIDAKQFSERIAKLRTDKKLTIQDMADAIDMPISTYYAYETGERAVSLLILFRLADYHKVSIDYLVGRVDLPAEHKYVKTGSGVTTWR